MVHAVVESQDAKSGLAQAEVQEAEFDWWGAVETYCTMLVSPSLLGLPESCDLRERLGYACFRSAMQAESVDEFRQRTIQAAESYKDAETWYGRQNQPQARGKVLRCRAMEAFLGYWLSPDATEKRKLVNESWQLTKDSLKMFQDSTDAAEYRKTLSRTGLTAFISNSYQHDSVTIQSRLEEAVQLSELAIELVSELGKPDELARAYVMAAGCLDLSFFASFQSDASKQEEYQSRAHAYWIKGRTISDHAALLQLSILGPSASFGAGSDEAVSTFEQALEVAENSKDRLVIGRAFENLAINLNFKATGLDDPDERTRLYAKALACAKRANEQYSVIRYTRPSGEFWHAEPHPAYFWQLSRDETDLGRRGELLNKALSYTPILLEKAKKSELPFIAGVAHHITSKILESLGTIETRVEKKRSLLERALEHRNATIRLYESMFPHAYSDLGTFHHYLASIKYELASIEENHEVKNRLVEDSLLTEEKGLGLYSKHMFWTEKSSYDLAILARRHLEFGDRLNSLYQITSYTAYLTRAAQAFEQAIKLFQKSGTPSRAAESLWKLGQVHDTLGEHINASREFSLASQNYVQAAEKIAQLKDFYETFAIYTQAWSNIENARYHHGRQEYSSAKEFYEVASNLQRSTPRWRYMAPNNSAWAELENAEDLSRKDESQEAIQVFGRAADLFGNARKSILDELGRVVDPAEKQTAVKLAKAADQREQYCRARIMLEEGKKLNRHGDRQASSQKYKQAADLFEEMASSSDSGAALREFMLVATVSKAWQAMTEAEASDSSSLYLGASRLFEEARQFSPTESTTMLVSGHSHFCRALEAGEKYVNTRETSFHASAMGHLESAALYYLKAGSHDASEYAKATGLLFDSYLQMDRAKKEGDPERKAKLYVMTEKLLQAAADSYSNAQYPGKNREVLELLDKVIQDREVAQSLLEILHSPSVVTAAQSFAIPFPTLDVPHGLEEFEHADIQAHLITQQSGVMIGDVLDLKISLVNAGRGPAQIVRIENAIPENFDLVEKPTVYAVETRHLNLRGRKLDPLKFVEVKLTLKPRIAGPVELKPRIVFLDEMGKSRVCEVESLDLAVGDPSLRAGAVVTMPLPSSKEVFFGDDVPIAFQIASVGGRPVTLVSFENLAPTGLVPVSANGGLLARRESLELSDLKLEPLRTHRISLVLKATGDGKIAFAPSLVYRDEIEGVRQEVVPASEIMIHPSSPILEFMIQAFANDYLTRRLSFERAGWRSLMEIVRGLKIPRSHTYGESRYGHTFGKPLETLVRTGLVEYRRFPGKGRGGEALKVRARYERDFVRRRVEATALHRLEGP